MKQRIIKKKDYEHYSFQMPVSVLLHNKRKNYICSELEKRQPCFSDDYCFDSKLKLNRKGITTDVFVMNKKQLFEYKKNTPLGNFGFHFEDFEKKIGFASKKNYVFLSAVFFCLIVFLFFGILNRREREVLSETEKMIEQVEFQEEQGKVPDEILSIIKENHGIIRTLEWKCDGKKESIQVDVEKIYPELFSSLSDNIKFSQIKYINNQPSLTLFCTSPIKDFHDVLINQNDKYLEKIRNLLLQKQIKLIEENCENSYISFSMGKNSDFYSEIEKIMEDEKIGIRLVNVSQLSSDLLCIRITFDKNLQNYSGNPFCYLEKYVSLFFKNNTVKTETHKTEIKMNTDKQKNRIGEISGDGNHTIFYKDENGRIIREVVK